jgi:hypothetical protein
MVTRLPFTQHVCCHLQIGISLFAQRYHTSLLTCGVAEGTGVGDWASAYKKAKAFVGKLSDDEKVNLTAGVSSKTGCSGYIQAIDRLGFPGICVSDAGNGLVSHLHLLLILTYM